MVMLKDKPKQLLIRVSTYRAKELENILGRVSPTICRGTDHHNTLMNGGFGPPGCVPSIDGEPHTTFSLTLGEDFYNEISVW
jgi:hypothetical protein